MFGRGGGMLRQPRPRFDPIGPHPGQRRPRNPFAPGRRDPRFGGGGGFGGFI